MANLGFLFDAAAHQALSNLAVALDLARAGIAVFPCQPDGAEAKRPYPGVFWRNQSTTNEQRIEQWWERWPDAVPGIDLAKTDFIVIDLDGEGGQADWRSITADRSVSAPRVETPSGGSHLWFRRNGRNHGNGRGALPPKRDHQGIDVRGSGGYVIAPGATMLDGRRYEADGHDFLSAQSAPDWLWAILDGPTDKGQDAAHASAPTPEPPRHPTDDRRRAYGDAALAAERERVATCGKGGRNEALNKAAFALGTLVGSGCLGEAQVRAALTDAAQACGLLKDDGPRACQATLTSGLRAGILRPRDVPESGDYVIDVGIGAEVAEALLARQVVEAPNGELVDAETGEFVTPAPIHIDAAQDYPDEALRVGGLVGEMADWIMSTAMYPCRLFAVSAALAAIGTVVGRQVYTGVPRAGTSLYWLTIAPTAGGKDRPQEAIKQMFAAADLSHLIKASVSSSAKLGMSLAEAPAQCQVIDEVGKVLRKFVSRNASSQELSLLDDYCSVWGKNLGSFEPEGVTTRGDASIRQPSLTFFGATTPTAFYAQLRSAQVAGGFLNRFLVMQRHQRVPENPDVQPEDIVPPVFVEALRTLHTWQDGRIMPAPSEMARDPLRPPTPFVVPVAPDAEPMLVEARARARAMIVRSDDDPILEVYARSAEMVKRMALVLACGRHWRDMSACRIEASDVAFASNLVDWCMGSFVEGLRNHMAENEHQANAKMVLALIRTAKGHKLTRSELYRKVDDRLQARELTGILVNLCEAGKIEVLEEKPPEGTKGGRPKTTYVLR
ncbi:bifunctional DNA primase/polymerase [Methylobacterium planeticum]|uniref:DUF3987 domain-containing protein n=1 Tax=Methylobacterium planeticum TaxID=2615211 RepID=A0A6N6MGB3_9HYPH|nr:bifunctional DNA primase/polymerase [Methylobacterium planeticum]KAB1068892.1 DUF3987 domain-containing protein [Methylobacterium planeticum]